MGVGNELKNKEWTIKELEKEVEKTSSNKSEESQLDIYKKLNNLTNSNQDNVNKNIEIEDTELINFWEQRMLKAAITDEIVKHWKYRKLR
ncbi:hypothetical protein NW731_02505 [Mycoplasmopsis felis]|uniref:hypothetical protein n=1 Tax=Mycoplasmopsis felis TaxID=33923 RepID=UPI0021E0D876|nr:hypothetical protein [Mycoplasmopsis felis]MCU9937349.1 hypothetical protein [Mycoplasmopsis felis]